MSEKINIPLSTLEKHNHIVGDIERGVKLYERGGVEFAEDASLGYIADIPEKDGRRVKLTFTEDGRDIESFYCTKCSMRSGRAICRHVVAGVLAIQGGFPEETTLQTEHLLLRPLSIKDFDAVHSWAGNPENVRYMAWGPNDEAQTHAFLSAAKAGYDFAVVLKSTATVIGSCGIYPDERNDTGTVGWILHKDHWQRGYGTELAGGLIRYGFEDLKLRRITAPCAAVNYGSYRVMERSGMSREALHRKAFWARVDKQWIDEAVYAILAEDYFARDNEINTD